MDQQNTSTVTSNNRKLLIVEDDKALADILGDRFRSDGFKVESAPDGKQGLKKALDWLPDVILLDIVMPEMDGISMLRELRADDKGKEVQVILLTNLSDSQKVYEAMSHNVFDYLIKSDWEIDDIVKEVRSKAKLPPR